MFGTKVQEEKQDAKSLGELLDKITTMEGAQKEEAFQLNILRKELDEKLAYTLNSEMLNEAVETSSEMLRERLAAMDLRIADLGRGLTDLKRRKESVGRSFYVSQLNEISKTILDEGQKFRELFAREKLEVRYGLLRQLCIERAAVEKGFLVFARWSAFRRWRGGPRCLFPEASVHL